MADSRRTLRALAKSKDLEGAPLLVAVNKQDKLAAAENVEGGDEDVVGFYTTADVVRPTLYTLTNFCVHECVSVALDDVITVMSDCIPDNNSVCVCGNCCMYVRTNDIS